MINFNQEEAKKEMEKAREQIRSQIENAEQNLDDLMSEEPEDEESRTYEKWLEKVDNLEDYIDRCHVAWEELHQISLRYKLDYKEDDWLD